MTPRLALALSAVGLALTAGPAVAQQVIPAGGGVIIILLPPPSDPAVALAAEMSRVKSHVPAVFGREQLLNTLPAGYLMPAPRPVMTVGDHDAARRIDELEKRLVAAEELLVQSAKRSEKLLDLMSAMAERQAKLEKLLTDKKTMPDPRPVPEPQPIPEKK